jgi:hypothetical protein
LLFAKDTVQYVSFRATRDAEAESPTIPPAVGVAEAGGELHF